MTLLQPMLDGALAAAELLALLFVSPAAAREPATLDAPAAFERPVHLHRLSTAVESPPARIAGRRSCRAGGANGPSYRVMLPARFEADAPRAMLVDEDDGAFLLIVAHRAAPRGTLVLRPAYGEPETLQLGAIDTRHAILVPLPDRAHLDRLADGAVELELADDRGTWWTTLIAERIDERPALQTRGAE